MKDFFEEVIDIKEGDNNSIIVIEAKISHYNKSQQTEFEIIFAGAAFRNYFPPWYSSIP